MAGNEMVTGGTNSLPRCAKPLLERSKLVFLFAMRASAVRFRFAIPRVLLDFSLKIKLHHVALFLTYHQESVMTALQQHSQAGSAGSLRTGSEYLRSLNDGRQVYVDGEKVADVTKHPAFREAARSVARLYDVAAAPEMRERMTFVSPKTGSPVLRAYQIPRTHADLRARRLFSETWAESTFGL